MCEGTYCICASVHTKEVAFAAPLAQQTGV